MKILRWLKSLFCDSFSSRLKGSKRRKGENQAVYKTRRKIENVLTKAYIKGEIYRKGRT